MRSLMKSGVLVGAALLAVAMVGMTVAEEPKDALQGSWNDYPAKWIGNGEIPNVTPPPDEIPGYPETPEVPETPETPIPPGEIIPPQTPPGNFFPPGLIPPRQQQQGKPSGGFQWGGGKAGGKQWGGSFDWGKTKPPQSQQGAYPRPGGGQGTPNQAQLLEYIRHLQQQNAALRELIERLAGQQGMNDGRSPGLPSNGVPLQ